MSLSPCVALIESLVHLLLFKIPVVNFAWYSAGVTVQRCILFCSYLSVCCLCAEDDAYTTHAHTLAATQRGTHRVSKRCRCFQKAKLVVGLRLSIELHLVGTCLPVAEIRVIVISCKFQGIPKH